MKSKSLWVGVCLVLLGVAAYFSYFRDRGVVGFNDVVVQQVIQSDARFVPVFETFETYFEGKEEVSLPSLKEQVVKLKAGVEDDIERYQGIELQGGPAGEAFYEAGLNYLIVSKAYVTGFEQFLNYAEGHPGDIEGQTIFWGQIMGVLEQRSGEALDLYMESQQALADLHGFKIEED